MGRTVTPLPRLAGRTAAHGRTRGRGQALVEFSLVFPLFFVLLLAIFDFGRVIWARNSLENAAREAARYAIVHGGTETTLCPVGPDAMGRSGVCPGGSPGTNNAKNVARDWAIAAGDSVAVTVCYGAGCSGDTSTANNAPGTPVTVRTSSTMSLIVAPLFQLFDADFGTVSLDASITMLVNT